MSIHWRITQSGHWSMQARSLQWRYHCWHSQSWTVCCSMKISRHSKHSALYRRHRLPNWESQNWWGSGKRRLDTRGCRVWTRLWQMGRQGRLRCAAQGLIITLGKGKNTWSLLAVYVYLTIVAWHYLWHLPAVANIGFVAKELFATDEVLRKGYTQYIHRNN